MMPVTRPSPWLLAPVLTAFALFAVSHRDLVFATLCSLALLLAYWHRLSLAWPTGKRWRTTAGMALGAWTMCVVYYGTVMQSGAGLAYFQRIYYKPWLITTGSMLMALAVVWVWHVRASAGRTTRLILAWAGLMVVSSGNFVALSPLYLPLLALFCGATLLVLAGLGGGRGGGRARRGTQPWWHLAVAVGCLAVISAGAWTVSAGLRLVEQEIDLLIADVMQESQYTDLIGAGGIMLLERHRRVSLSRKVVATVDGAAWPGYLRTQVLTDYRQGRWKAEDATAQPLDSVMAGPDTFHPATRREHGAVRGVHGTACHPPAGQPARRHAVTVRGAAGHDVCGRVVCHGRRRDRAVYPARAARTLWRHASQRDGAGPIRDRRHHAANAPRDDGGG
jgi:hypothetical protein